MKRRYFLQWRLILVVFLLLSTLGIALLFPVFPVAAYVSGNGENRVIINRSIIRICATFETDSGFDTPHTVCTSPSIIGRSFSLDFSWSHFASGEFKPVDGNNYEEIDGARLRIINGNDVLLDHQETFYEKLDIPIYSTQ